MGRQTRPRKVFQAVASHLANPILPGQKVLPTRPPWFNALFSIPPSEILTRPIAAQIDPKRRLPKAGKSLRNLYKPQQIRYPEDALRDTFYRDHPWELARPRQILETDGCDGHRVDWSTGVRQKGIQLTGECVVQRQLWLMENASQTREQAYDIARREFYEERRLEQMERRIAVEEAQYVGAYFGKDRLQLGMEQEDRAWNRWKSLAQVQVEKLVAMRTVTDSGTSGTENEDLGIEELTEAAESKAEDVKA